MSEKAIISTYQGVNGPWQNLEYLFVVKPQNELNSFMEQCFGIAGLAGTAVLLKNYISSSSTITDTQAPTTVAKDPNKQIKNIFVVLSSLAAAKTLYNFIAELKKRNIQQQALLDILKHWDLYRLHMPTSLIEYFDELALQYQAKGKSFLTHTLVSEVFELVNHHIEHHFEARYKKAEQKTANHLETFKNCTDMWKNLE